MAEGVGGARGASCVPAVTGGEDSGSGCVGEQREGRQTPAGHTGPLRALPPPHLPQCPQTTDSQVGEDGWVHWAGVCAHTCTYMNTWSQ